MKKIVMFLFIFSMLILIGCGDEKATDADTNVIVNEDDSLNNLEDPESEPTDDVDTSDLIDTASDIVDSEPEASTKEVDGALYTGPFPAPEGIVLTGYTGKDEFKAPTGNGEYKFNLQTSWKQPIACKDETRTILGSKGQSYDNGFYKGHEVGTLDRETFPKPAFDDTPMGNGAGNKYYDEGYKIGYDRGYNDLSIWNAQYYCPDHTVDESDYDTDGWLRYENVESAPNVIFYAPPPLYSGLTYSSRSMLGSNSKSFSFELIDKDIMAEYTDLNKGKPALNLGRIDILQGTLEGEEITWSTEEFAQKLYDNVKQYADVNYKGSCVLGEPLIETKTYGDNTFAQLTFFQICKMANYGEPTWNLHAYAFMRNGNEQLTLAFNVPHDLKKKGVDDFDPEKLPSTIFLSQFMEKVEFN